MTAELFHADGQTDTRTDMTQTIWTPWGSVNLDTIGEWAVEKGTMVNPGKSKAIRFTIARVKNPLGHSLGDQTIPEASICQYLGIILRSDLNWVDQVNYIVQKAWKALHFVMRVLKTGNRNTKSLAHTSLVRPILEYGAAYWDPCTAGQINASDRVQMKPFNLLIIRRNATGKPLAKRSTIARLCALFKAYSLEWAWKDTRDRLRRPYYLSRVDHVRKFGDK